MWTHLYEPVKNKGWNSCGDNLEAETEARRSMEYFSAEPRSELGESADKSEHESEPASSCALNSSLTCTSGIVPSTPRASETSATLGKAGGMKDQREEKKESVRLKSYF